MTILKYTVEPWDGATHYVPSIYLVEMPQDAIPISCGIQRDRFVIWALSDTQWFNVKRPVLLWWTGHDALPDKPHTGMPVTGALTNWKHLGTHMDSLGLAWHVFV